jgi:thiamine-phosphate pyrophosphorylase
MASALGRLHLVTDSRPGANPVPVVRAALSRGVPVVQIRMKSLTDREAYALASTVVALCHSAGAACLVNDRLHIALAVGADGAHVGADDLPVAAARQVLGPAAILGATARDPVAARAASAAGASYVGVGPVYATTTKQGLPDPIGPRMIAVVASTVDVPVIAIGGVTPGRVPELRRAGAYGIAVVGAVCDAPDPGVAVAAFLGALDACSHLPAARGGAGSPAGLDGAGGPDDRRREPAPRGGRLEPAPRGGRREPAPCTDVAAT